MSSHTLSTKQSTDVSYTVEAEKPGTFVPGFLSIIVFYSTEKDIVTAGSICQYSWIDYFTAGTALPRVKSTNKVIIFLSIHAGFTLRTSHDTTSYFISDKESLSVQNVYRGITQDMPTLKKTHRQNNAFSS